MEITQVYHGSMRKFRPSLIMTSDITSCTDGNGWRVYYVNNFIIGGSMRGCEVIYAGTVICLAFCSFYVNKCQYLSYVRNILNFLKFYRTW